MWEADGERDGAWAQARHGTAAAGQGRGRGRGRAAAGCSQIRSTSHASNPSSHLHHGGRQRFCNQLGARRAQPPRQCIVLPQLGRRVRQVVPAVVRIDWAVGARGDQRLHAPSAAAGAHGCKMQKGRSSADPPPGTPAASAAAPPADARPPSSTTAMFCPGFRRWYLHTTRAAKHAC